MPSAAQLAHIEPTEGDGSSVVKNDDDSTQTSWPDGTVRLDEPDGSVIVTFPDHSVLHIATDGTRALIDDGSPLDPTTGGPLSGPFVFVCFRVLPALPPNVKVSITPAIGEETFPTILVRKRTQKYAWWVVYSDKYVQESEFSYTMTVEVDGPNLTDEPVIYSTAAPVKVATVQGRSKFLPAVIAKLPAVPDDKNAIVKDYVSRSVVAET